MNWILLIFLDILRSLRISTSLDLNYHILCILYANHISSSEGMHWVEQKEPLDLSISSKYTVKKFSGNKTKITDQIHVEIENDNSKVSNMMDTVDILPPTRKFRSNKRKRLSSIIPVYYQLHNPVKRSRISEEVHPSTSSTPHKRKGDLNEATLFTEFRKSLATRKQKVAYYIIKDLAGFNTGKYKAVLQPMKKMILPSYDSTIYVDLLNRIISNINSCFLSKGENFMSIKNMNDSTKDTSLGILDNFTNHLKKNEFCVSQYENEELTNLFFNLRYRFLLSLKDMSEYNFYCLIKKAASIIYNGTNSNPNEIIKGLLYEMRILKYEVRNMRSLILIIIYFNSLENKEDRKFLDCFICRLYVLFKFLNSFNTENIDIIRHKKISYVIYKTYYILFYGEGNRNAPSFINNFDSNSKKTYKMIDDSKILMPFRLPDFLLFHFFGFKMFHKIHSTFLNILQLIRSDYRNVFKKTDCYVFLQKISAIGDWLIPEKTDFIVPSPTKTYS
ncbi:hypothetical protein NGRA_1742 [Nosema granulosis]|uniref:Uncharacterized protein n=1 Tax=Nosema granulosis TaxID=83296 RepID=A0A9P6GYB4_9MICR|nr:hypothetical protein NGRA_1742 [Nosema granulosis]